mgnify:CR=1 FL=1
MPVTGILLSIRENSFRRSAGPVPEACACWVLPTAIHRVMPDLPLLTGNGEHRMS